MSLTNRAAKPPSPKINPEIDAKLNQFIASNKGLYDSFMKMDKERLVRKLMLQKMNISERAAKQVGELRNVIDADPALKSQVERAIARMPEDRREAAYKGVAQSVLARQAVKAAAPRLSA